jgi:hypothetical protein
MYPKHVSSLGLFQTFVGPAKIDNGPRRAGKSASWPPKPGEGGSPRPKLFSVSETARWHRDVKARRKKNWFEIP